MLSVVGVPQFLYRNDHAIHGLQIQGVTEQKLGVTLLTFVQNVDQSLIKGLSAENAVYTVAYLDIVINIILLITRRI